MYTLHVHHHHCVSVCVEVLWPSQPNGVMSSMVSLPNHTFTGQALSSKRLTMFVRLSLLTMTNPNQLCAVLLFVCSKMADKTSLSSKLPVADRTREI